MSKSSKLFLFLLFLGDISSFQLGLNQDKVNAKELKFGSFVKYDKDNNYFTFNFTRFGHYSISKIFFSLEDNQEEIYLIDPSGNRFNIWKEDEEKYEYEFGQIGTYYVEVICKSYRCELGGTFKSLLTGAIIDTIDLSKSVYFSDVFYWFKNNHGITEPGLIQYRISGLKEDKYVIFINAETINYYNQNTYPHYPDDSSLSPSQHPGNHEYLTPFEVLNVNTGQINKTLKYFEFKQNNEYIIKIHPFIYPRDDTIYYGYKYYFYHDYFFFPITENNFQMINGEVDSILAEGPIIGIINHNNIVRDFSIYLASADEDSTFYTATTNDIISNNIEGLSLITQLHFQKGRNHIDIKANIQITTIIILRPSYRETQTRLLIVDEYDDKCRNSYSVPVNKSIIISCDHLDDYEGYYPVLTYTSSNKNMKFVLSMETESTDFIIQNDFFFSPIFIQKSNQTQTIIVKHYDANFALFGAENEFLYKSYFNRPQKIFNAKNWINIINYFKLTQMNMRINSVYLKWFAFCNAYLNNLNIGANIYIKQLYGGSELYECSASDGQRDLTFLTTPISNKECKNKKSLFNRLFSIDGTKIISGYITPDSYFDIYIEIGLDQKNEINISPIMTDELETNNAAKYLRKDVNYTINFKLNHMVKLDPTFNAEIIITNGESSIIINSEKRASPVNGSGFTIKSNGDAMVYFIGKYDTNKWAQKEIDIDKSRGKIVMTYNVDDDLVIDTGFKGYCPSTILMKRQPGSGSDHYFDNMYDKLKEQLVDGEKIYIYYKADKNKNLGIHYLDKSLANKNNEFNIFLIPGNNEYYTLAIYSYEVKQLMTDFYFCHNNTNLLFSFSRNDQNSKTMTITNDNVINEKFELSIMDNKMYFKANNSLIFAYSFYDNIDEIFNEKDILKEKRVVLNDLKIEEVKYKEDVDNVVWIKFKPNYKQSSTRYIIIIAQQNNENTLEEFKNPCHIIDLLNQRPFGVKVETIYDNGASDSITLEVNITDILHSSNKYVVNIISHELRFDKKINFYQPLGFNYGENQPIDPEPIPEPNSDYEQDPLTDHEPEPNPDSEHNPETNSDPESESNPSGNNGDINGDNKHSSDTNLALAISLPIVGVIIVAVVVIFIFKRKRPHSSEEIEKLTGN